MTERRDSSGRVLNPWEVTPGTKPVTNFVFQVTSNDTIVSNTTVVSDTIVSPEDAADEKAIAEAKKVEGADDTGAAADEAPSSEAQEIPVVPGKRRLGR